MLSLLTPNSCLNSIQELNIENLSELGIRGLIFDLDNTLLPWDSVILPPEVFSYLANLKACGFEICIVSNNSKGRVRELTKTLEIPALSKAIKPRRKAFLKAMDLMGTCPADTAVVGDQIFTDVLGGNRLGLYTILITPINKNEFFGTRLVRKIEKVVLKRLRRKGVI